MFYMVILMVSILMLTSLYARFDGHCGYHAFWYVLFSQLAAVLCAYVVGLLDCPVTTQIVVAAILLVGELIYQGVHHRLTHSPFELHAYTSVLFLSIALQPEIALLAYMPKCAFCWANWRRVSYEDFTSLFVAIVLWLGNLALAPVLHAVPYADYIETRALLCGLTIVVCGLALPFIAHIRDTEKN